MSVSPAFFAADLTRSRRRPRATRIREVKARLEEPWFSWIGGHSPGGVFYRIPSPVVIAELDHHCRVFLDYGTLKHLHVHAVQRTPHGNDCGRTGRPTAG